MTHKFLLAFAFLTVSHSAVIAQKRYAQKDEKVEILKKDMSLQSWITDDKAVFRLTGSPHDRTPPSYIQVNTKTGKQSPFEEKLLATTSKIEATVSARGGDLFYKTETGESIQLTQSKEEEVNPVLSPDKKYVAFGRNNNLYSIRLADRKETQLTSDGSDVILNGYASLVYEEDVLSGGYRTFWWSPDSKHIAFYRFDDSQVPEFILTDIQPLPIRGGRHVDTRTPDQVRQDYQQNKIERYRYSKPGDNNAAVKVGFVKPESAAVVWADFEENEDCYYGDPYWRPDGKGLWVQWMNRGQDTLNIYNINPETGAKGLVYEENQRTWVMIKTEDRVRFLPSGKSAIIMSDKSGWDQLYHYSLDGKLLNRITDGDYKVLDVINVDEKSNSLYFTCFKDNIAYTDLYKVGLDGKNLKRLTFGDYSHKVNLSPNAKYFVTTYFNPSTPEKVALLNTDGKLIADLYDRKGADFGKYETDRYEIITVKSDDGRFDIPMRVRWPAGMEKGKQYPLHVRIYGGPNMMWMTQPYFSAIPAEENEDKAIMVFMDHRGSGLCGKVGADDMHRNLGYWELKDYTTLVQWLVKNGQADPNKVLIQGHSYGGYMSCYALTHGNGVFQSAIAGAPVTDWLLYNTAYTERYMDSPAENPEGYQKSSVVYNADNFQGRLFIAHGMSDNNVHVQNTMQFIGELQRLNKTGFELMLYPEDRHSLIGKHLNHYNATMKKFQQSCLFDDRK